MARSRGKLGWTYLAHRTDQPPQTALIALYADMSGATLERAWRLMDLLAAI